MKRKLTSGVLLLMVAAVAMLQWTRTNHSLAAATAREAAELAPEIRRAAASMEGRRLMPEKARMPVPPARKSPGLQAPAAGPPAVRDRYADAVTLAQRELASKKKPGRIERQRLIKTDFKYPLLRIEDEYEPGNGEPHLVRQVASVADHLVLKPLPGVTGEVLLQRLKHLNATLRKRMPASGLWLVSFPDADLDTVPQALAEIDSIGSLAELAEPDFLAHANVIPNDSGFSELWGMHNTGQSGGTADADIDAPEAWNLHTGSASVVVSVIDSGVDYTHQDLAANIWVNPGEIAGNGIDDDHNGYIDDVRGWDFLNNDNNPMDDADHGTHVAGIIGGAGNNGFGVTGVCWRVSIMPLKFLNQVGYGTTSDATEAVSYATAKGVTVTSNSWGGSPYSQSLKNAIDAANTSGILFVTAAGNESTNNDSAANYPPNYASSNIIAVAATTRQDQLWSSSNYGLAKVHLGAPGCEIYSTTPGNTYAKHDGTSMAAPHVAGACALVKALHPGLTHMEIRNFILGATDPIPALAGKTVTGGRLNVYKALQHSNEISIMPPSNLVSWGPIGGPFTPVSAGYTLTNPAATAVNWSVTDNPAWLTLSQTGGSLAGGASVTLNLSVNAAANALAAASHAGTLTFHNATSGVDQTRVVTLQVAQTDYFTEWFDITPNDTANQSFTFTPDGSGSYYAAGRRTVASFATDPSGDTALTLPDDSYALLSLAGGAQVHLYGVSYGGFYMNSNGSVTFGSSDIGASQSLAAHFSKPRIAALCDDLNPAAGGTVSWRQWPDRAAVTFQDVPEKDGSGTNSFQIEMFFDGRVRITLLNVSAPTGIIGLSQGRGIPADFFERDFSTYPPLAAMPVSINMDGALPGGMVGYDYIRRLDATDGTSSYVWSVAAGSALPGGLSLSAAGLLSGTPTAAGSFSFTVKVTDSANTAATRTMTLTVLPALLVTTNSTLPPGISGSAYLHRIIATGGTPGYSWSLVPANSLPPGLFFSSSGVLSGTPVSDGAFSFSLRVTDNASVVTTKELSLRVVAALAISPPFTLPGGTAASVYNHTLAATGGATPFTWTVTPGSTLPTGLSLSPTGVLTGTPTHNGHFSFSVTATDSLSFSWAQSLSISIKAAGAGNTAPSAVTDRIATLGTGALILPVLANDIDADGDALRITGITMPAHGAATFTADNVTYTPVAGYTGADTFQYTAADGYGGLDTGIIEISMGSLLLGLPGVETGAASKIGDACATVGGTVNPQGTNTSVWFEYGTSASYGSATVPQAAGASAATVPVSVDLAGLRPATDYHFRAVALSAAGISFSGDLTFATVRGFYVNDVALDADNWCTDMGDEANDGLSPATPKASVQALLNSYDLEPGETVRIDTGSYTVPYTITVDSSDGGSSVAPVTFEGSPYGVVILPSNNGQGGWYVKAPYVTIRTATNSKYPDLDQSYMKITGGSIGVQFDSTAGNYLLSRLQLDGNSYDGIYVSSPGGIIENCLIKGGSYGISIASTSTGVNTVRNCTIAGFTAGGISISRYANGLSLSNSIVVADGINNPNAVCVNGWLLATSDFNNLAALNGASTGMAVAAAGSHSLSTDPLFVNPSANDYHLKSTAGSYHGGLFTADDTHSPCIDTGDPATPVGAEPGPNGERINLGAYGGTKQASLTASGRCLFVVSPNGGEVLTGTHVIRWITTGNGWQAGDTVKLETSIDGGSTWQAIMGAAGIDCNAGQFSWDTTRIASGPCLARVTANGGTFLSDVSDRTLLIHNLPVVFHVNDVSLDADNWCSAAGDDANDGLSADTPKATVQAILSAYDLEPGDIVRIDTGTYTLTSDITVDSADGGSSVAPVIFEGSPYGVTINRNNPISGKGWYLKTNYLMIHTATSAKHPGLFQSGMTITGADRGIESTGYGCTLSRLQLGGNTSIGICLNGGDALAENCLVHGGICGISCSSASSGNIRNCTVVNFSNSGIWSNYSSSLNLINNIIVADGAGCAVRFEFVYSPTVSDYNNLVALNGASVGYAAGAACPTLSDWQRAAGSDGHSLSADPLFVNPSACDYHLSSTAGSYHGGLFTADATHSPCVDAGDPVSVVGAEAGPNGGRINLGAYGGTEQASLTASGRQLYVVSPNGREDIIGTYVIRWLATGGGWQPGDTVKLESSSNGGSTWQTVPGASALAYQAGQFSWNTTSTASGRCLIRVTTNGTDLVSDASDFPALIHNLPLVFYVNDVSLNADNWCSTLGNDANDGLSPATPKANVLAILGSYDLAPGDIVRIDTGNYTLTSDITVGSTDGGSSTAQVTFEGSPFGVTLYRDSTLTANSRCGWHVNAPYVTICTATSTRYRGLARSGMRITSADDGVSLDSAATNCILSRLQMDHNNCGIYAGSASVTIENCIIRGGSSGIHTNPSSVISCTISNCTVLGFSSRGISSFAASSLKLSNTIIVADGADCYGLYCYSGTTPTASDFNDLVARNGASVGHSEGTARTTLSAWQSATGKDRESMSFDPSFVNAAGGNYHLSVGSPCRDMGGNSGVSANSFDIDGQSRIVGGFVDIGADEFVEIPDIEVELPAGVALVDGAATLAFGSVEPGHVSESVTLTLRNAGTLELTNIAITMGGANATDFTLSSIGAATLAAGTSAALTVQFTPSGVPGMRSATLRIASNDVDENPFEIVLTGSVRSPQETWRQVYFDRTDNSGNGADLNDFDNDGIPNLLEFAFGLNPRQNSAGLLPKPQKTGDNLVISFTEPTGISGITYGAEWSQTLCPGSWTAVADTGTPPKHTFSVPIGIQTNLFMRLSVTSQ